MTQSQPKQTRRWNVWRLLALGLIVIMLAAPSAIYFWPRDPDTVPTRADGSLWRMDHDSILPANIAKYFPDDYWVRATRILYYRPGRFQPVRTFDGSNYVTYVGRSSSVHPSLPNRLPDNPTLPPQASLRDKITQDEIQWISEHASLRALHLPNTDLTGLDLTPLRRLRQLRFLELNIASLTPDDLAWISKLKKLTGLYLRGIDVRQSNLDYLANLRKLEDVLFDGLGLTDQKLAFLANQDNLRIAKFPYAGITGSCLDGLNNPQNITRITLTGCNITPHFMNNISRFTNMHIFWVSFTDFDDDDLKQIVNLPGINSLNIANTQVTGQGLTALHPIKTLTKLRADAAFLKQFTSELNQVAKSTLSRIEVNNP